MNGEDTFAQALLELDGDTPADVDAALAAAVHFALRASFDGEGGCWRGRDEHDTLRQTCHAVEVLYRLNLDADSAAMAHEAGNWLINLPISDRMQQAERTQVRLYPSRFKTLAYIRRFDDDFVQRDFADLLGQEVGGMIRGVTESDILTTCIVLDTLVTLERQGRRRAVCPDERYAGIIRALRQHFQRWRPAGAPSRVKRNPHAATGASARVARRITLASEIVLPRDLSYVLGLLLSADGAHLAPRQVAAATSYLAGTIHQRDKARGSDLVQVLYAALQLAEHCLGDEDVQHALRGLLAELRLTYAKPDEMRRWDLANHAQVLRLLLSYYGEAALSQNIVACLLRSAERRRSAARNTLETELKQVIRERVEIEFGAITELSGGFTTDQIFRVPFGYWYPMPGYDGSRPAGLRRVHEASVIIKRSTSDAFHTATENYRLLPPAVRDFFVRQPSEMQVYKSERSSAYYLTMEDLDNLSTFEQLLNEWDQRAMHEAHIRLLRSASDLICQASFTLFRQTQSGRTGFPGTQIARLYLSPIEGKLARAIARVPWLKNPLQGYVVGDQRYKALEYYLGVISRHATLLQPRSLGLTHGDLHARNVMLDRACTQFKLIDLDKLSWSGDFVADLAHLLTDVCVYRRVAEPGREFGLAREDILFISRSSEPSTAEITVRYPALGRPATVVLQEHMLKAIAEFAAEQEDASWKQRLWLAAATALFIRLAFQTQKEPAAVLYAEGIRLLHEVCRALDHGQELPPLLVPAQWPQPALMRAAVTASELPGWLAGNRVLRALHEGLREAGLRALVDAAGVNYYAAGAEGDRPLAKLVPPRREGMARLLLPAWVAPEIDSSALKLVRSAQTGDALGTILIILAEATPSDILTVVRSCLAQPAAVNPPRAR